MLFKASISFIMESIKDRLAHIIRAKNLTATQFAEMMQIQPSNVSHLLSGRNKPSLDFLIKLKDVFPEYSFDWIILGKKPITISERQPIAKAEVDFTEIKQTVDNDYEKGLFDFVGENYLNNVLEEKSDPIQSNSKKQVKQLIYVYEDHTFEIYDIRN